MCKGTVYCRFVWAVGGVCEAQQNWSWRVGSGKDENIDEPMLKHFSIGGQDVSRNGVLISEAGLWNDSDYFF